MADNDLGSRCILAFERVEEDALTFAEGAQDVDCQLVILAVDTERAKEIARTLSPSMIVLGFGQTGEIEFRFLKELRELAHLNEIPIVVFSRDVSESEVGQAFELGVDRVFLKPPIKEDFIACAKAIVSRESNLDASATKYEKFPLERQVVGGWQASGMIKWS